MNYTLDQALDTAANLIRAIESQENGEQNETLILKLEATLMCFQHHINQLTKELV